MSFDPNDPASKLPTNEALRHMVLRRASSAKHTGATAEGNALAGIPDVPSRDLPGQPQSGVELDTRLLALAQRPPPMPPEARRLPEGFEGIRALVSAALLLPEPERGHALQSALEAARTVPIERGSAVAGPASLGFDLPRLATLLSGTSLQEPFMTYWGGDGIDRVRGLALIAPHLAEPERSALMQEVADAVLGIRENQLARAQALTDLFPYMHGERQSDLIPVLSEALDDIPDSFNRAFWTLNAASILPEPHRDHVLRSGRAILRELAEASDGEAPDPMLVVLHDQYARHSQGDDRASLIEQALALARRVQDVPQKAQMLLVLSRWYDGALYAALFEESVALLDTVETHRLHAWAAQQVSWWAKGHVLPWPDLPETHRLHVARIIAAAAGFAYFRRPLQEVSRPIVNRNGPPLGLEITESDAARTLKRMTAEELVKLAAQAITPEAPPEPNDCGSEP
jgi:hypothetical protein